MAIAATKPVLAAPFNGSSVAVDTAGYLAQHEVVYNAPPRRGAAAMPIGDGDLTAMVWCPGEEARIQVQKSNLWYDASAQGGPAAASQVLSAAELAFRTEPAPLASPERFEQRLSLYAAEVRLEASAQQGSCELSAWVAATAGVLCVTYRDSLIRGGYRHIELRAPRNARPFAVGEHIGLIEVLPDRRCAVVCRLADAPAATGWTDARTPRFDLQSARGIGATLLLAVAVTDRDGDPIAAAKARLASALRVGTEALQREHRQHWRAFWQKSFLHLSSPDELASYAENLWYLNLYQMAACGINDYPVSPDASAWATSFEARPGSAVYPLRNTQMLYWPFYAANHLEIPERFIEFLDRVRPRAQRDTKERLGLEGVRLPERMDRSGGDASADLPGENEAPISLECAALFYWRWRYSADPVFLARRAYPFLKSCVTYHIARLRSRIETAGVLPEEAAPLRFGLQALVEMATALETDQELREQWNDLLGLLPPASAAEPGENACGENEGVALYRPDTAFVFPFGGAELDGPDRNRALALFRRCCAEEPLSCWSTAPIVAARLGLRDTVQDLVAEWIERFQAHPQGFFASGAGGAEFADRPLRLEPGAILAMTLNEMCLQSHGGIVRLFAGLPWDWEGVFNLRCEGGFRVMAQIADREVVWAAIESLTGERCRLANPWHGVARVQLGRRELVRSDERLLEFPTERGGIYTVDRPDRPLSRMLRIRLTGRRPVVGRRWGSRQLGLD